MLQYAIVIAFNGKCLKKVPVRNKKNRKNFKNNFLYSIFALDVKLLFTVIKPLLYHYAAS